VLLLWLSFGAAAAAAADCPISVTTCFTADVYWRIYFCLHSIYLQLWGTDPSGSTKQ